MNPLRNHVPLAVAAVAVTLGLAACGPSRSTAADIPAWPTPAAPGASSTPAGPAPLPNPCDLVTKPEADALAATPLNAPTHVGYLCMYTSPVTGPLAQVEVSVGDGPKKALDIDRDTLHHPFTSVVGIGDEAVTEDGMIFFRKADIWVGIRLVRGLDPDKSADRLQSAARTAAGRM
jgi:hypothetical protein